MGKILFSSLFAIMLMAGTCANDQDNMLNSHPGLKITNHSNSRIRYNFYWNYPETSIGAYNPATDGSDGLSTGESFTRGAGLHSCWEDYFQNGKKEWIYIFDADTIETLSWDVVQQTNRGLLERKEIDLDYLQSHGFEIIYQ